MSFDELIFQENIFDELKKQLAEDSRFVLANEAASDIYSISILGVFEAQAYSLSFSLDGWGEESSAQWTSSVQLVAISGLYGEASSLSGYQLLSCKGLPFQDPVVLVSMVLASMDEHSKTDFVRRQNPAYYSIVSPHDEVGLANLRVGS